MLHVSGSMVAFPVLSVAPTNYPVRVASDFVWRRGEVSRLVIPPFPGLLLVRAEVAYGPSWPEASHTMSSGVDLWSGLDLTIPRWTVEPSNDIRFAVHIVNHSAGVIVFQGGFVVVDTVQL